MNNNNIDQNNSSDRHKSNTNHSQLKKGSDRSCSYRNRLKSSIVRDPNGSISTFKQFYQSGGRDYEHYRLWLQTLSRPEQLPISSNPQHDTNYERKNIESNITVGVPRSVASALSSSHPNQSSSTLRFTRAYPLVRPVRNISLRRKPELPISVPALFSSLMTTTSLKSQSCMPKGYSQTVVEPTSSSSLSSFIDWSVVDVGHFIEKHCSEKYIARKFVQQKIDGRTLPLLTEDHLTRIFKMKLGPALQLLTLISNMQTKT